MSESVGGPRCWKDARDVELLGEVSRVRVVELGGGWGVLNGGKGGCLGWRVVGDV